MVTLKLRLMNPFGSPDQLKNPDDIEVVFPYENSEALVKRMSRGHVKLLNPNRGEIEVNISGFEVQGIPSGKNQNFIVRVSTEGKRKEFIFSRALHVETIDERKVILKL